MSNQLTALTRLSVTQERVYRKPHGAVLVENVLADLLHYCAVNGVDFEAAYRVAEIHYHAECKEDATNG